MDFDNKFMGGGKTAIGQAEDGHALAEFRLAATAVVIGLQHSSLRAEFIDLRFGPLNTPDQPLGIVVQANVNNQQSGYPQNTVDVANGPGIVFAEEPVQPDKIVEPRGQSKLPTRFSLLHRLDSWRNGDGFGSPKGVLSHDVGMG